MNLFVVTMISLTSEERKKKSPVNAHLQLMNTVVQNPWAWTHCIVPMAFSMRKTTNNKNKHCATTATLMSLPGMANSNCFPILPMAISWLFSDCKWLALFLFLNMSFSSIQTYKRKIQSNSSRFHFVLTVFCSACSQCIWTRHDLSLLMLERFEKWMTERQSFFSLLLSCSHLGTKWLLILCTKNPVYCFINDCMISPFLVKLGISLSQTLIIAL